MKPTSLPKKIMRCLSIFWSNYLDLSNMYLRISLRNFEEFSGSPKTAKMPHILTNWRVQRNWTDLERENHPHVLTDENLSNSAKFRIHLQSLDYYRWVNCNFFQDCIRFFSTPFRKLKFYSWWNPPVYPKRLYGVYLFFGWIVHL